MFKSVFSLFFCLFLFQNSGFTQNFSGGFNFALPAFDSSAQKFLPSFPAYRITEAHRVHAGSKGQFQLPDSRPIRFWGVNITAAGAFPAKNKAAGIAARLRKMGVNLVRFHHLENNWTGDDGCIFIYTQGTRKLNPATLDRLEYFIAQLRRNGIYVNMNLNVSRLFKESDGVRGADSMPEFAKAVTLFDPQLQMLQREYAQQLMQHINPYTGSSLAADPVLAMMEMNNENTVYGAWKDDALRPIGQGGWLIQRHNRMLDSLWNVWLTNKYGTQAALTAAWNTGITTQTPPEILQQGGFENSSLAAPWSLELHSTAQAVAGVTNQGVFSGNYAGQLQVNTVTGTDWHIQLKNTGFSLKKDSSYVLKFAAKATANRTFNVSAMRDNAPYTWFGGATFAATTQWQIFTFIFKATEEVLNAGRISISPGNSTGTFFFDAFSLGPPVIAGILPGEALTSQTAKRILYADRLTYSDRRTADMAAFYTALERQHFNALRAYLKNNLSIAAPITGTNALTGPAGASANADMDYIDDHSYWAHPSFPQGAWDGYWWNIDNSPMIKSTELWAITNIFSGLAMQNKPYTVSEYNHAAPNRFRTEMVAALLAYSAFHGADGLMWFDYNGGTDWESDFVDGFFSIHRDHSIMGLFPACAYAYREGMIAEASNPTLLQYSQEWINNTPKRDNEGRWGKFSPFDKRLSLTHSLRVTSYDAAQPTNFDALPQPGNGPFVTQNGETTLDVSKGLLTTGTPRFCAITGFLADATNLRAGNLQIRQANDFGSLTWVSLGAAPLQQAARSLLTLSTKIQNTGMLWDGLQTVHDNWGTAPTKIAAATVALRLYINADSIRLFILDATGKEGAQKTFLPAGNGFFDVVLDQNQQKTMWWGLEALGGTVTGAVTPEAKSLNARVYPNPVSNGELQIALELPQSAAIQLTIFNELGQTVATQILQGQAGPQNFTVSLPDLPAGTYQYSLQTADHTRVGNGTLVVIER